MPILTDFGYLHLSLKQKDILLKKLQSDFRWTLAYLALKIERNRIFHLYHEILNLSEFYRQALLTCRITHNYFASFYPQHLLLLLKEAKIHAFSLKMAHVKERGGGEKERKETLRQTPGFLKTAYLACHA